MSAVDGLRRAMQDEDMEWGRGGQLVVWLLLEVLNLLGVT